VNRLRILGINKNSNGKGNDIGNLKRLFHEQWLMVIYLNDITEITYSLFP